MLNRLRRLSCNYQEANQTIFLYILRLFRIVQAVEGSTNLLELKQWSFFSSA